MPSNSKRRRQAVPTLSQALTRYLAEVSTAKKGHAGERSIVKVWLATRLAGLRVDRIRSTDLGEIRNAWLVKVAASTVVRRLALLSHMFTVLRKDWGMGRLCYVAQRLTEGTRHPCLLGRGQFQQICSVAGGNDQIGFQPRADGLDQDVDAQVRTAAAGRVADNPAHGIACGHCHQFFAGLQGNNRHAANGCIDLI